METLGSYILGEYIFSLESINTQIYRNTFVDVEWSQLARFPCWKIHQDTVSEFLGTSNLMLHGFLQ